MPFCDQAIFNEVRESVQNRVARFDPAYNGQHSPIAWSSCPKQLVLVRCCSFRGKYEVFAEFHPATHRVTATLSIDSGHSTSLFLEGCANVSVSAATELILDAVFPPDTYSHLTSRPGRP